MTVHQSIVDYSDVLSDSTLNTLPPSSLQFEDHNDVFYYHQIKHEPDFKQFIEAMEKEWASLRKLQAWDEKYVREWSDVRNEARDKKVRNHVGMIFGFCVEMEAS